MGTEINFWEIAVVIEWVMVFLEKRTIFFECFMDIPDFKTCKVIKIEFNKQIMGRCDSKIDFRVFSVLLLIKNQQHFIFKKINSSCQLLAGYTRIKTFYRNLINLQKGLHSLGKRSARLDLSLARNVK